MTVEPIETDWENRTQIITVPATLFFHFYGEYEQKTTSVALCGGTGTTPAAPTALVYSRPGDQGITTGSA